MVAPRKILVTLDPRDEAESPSSAVLAPRPATLDGKVIGLLSNNKPRSEELLRLMADLIGERYSIKGTVEYNKERHQWPAGQAALKDLASKCDVAIHATAE